MLDKTNNTFLIEKLFLVFETESFILLEFRLIKIDSQFLQLPASDNADRYF